METLFSESFIEFWKVLDISDVIDDTDDTTLPVDYNTLLNKLASLAKLIDRLSLFSPNEEIDDIGTVSLKYLLIPFAIAEVVYSDPSQTNKMQRIENALVYWSVFMHEMNRFGLTAKEDAEAWRNKEKVAGQNTNVNTSFAQRRAEKISGYKMQKEICSRLREMFQKRQKYFGSPWKWMTSTEECDQYEEEERELTKSLLSLLAHITIERTFLAEQELTLLKEATEASPPLQSNEVLKEAPSKPFICRIEGPNSTDVRQFYRESVFQQPHLMPTISLAEVADWEMAYSKRLGPGGEESKQKKKEDDELDVHEFSEKELRDRLWDDWKDENPKGSGNKQRNVG